MQRVHLVARLPVTAPWTAFPARRRHLLQTNQTPCRFDHHPPLRRVVDLSRIGPRRRERPRELTVTFAPATHPEHLVCGPLGGAECECPRGHMGWWSINTCSLIAMLERCRAGEDPEDVYMEYYLESDHEYPVINDEGDE